MRICLYLQIYQTNASKLNLTKISLTYWQTGFGMAGAFGHPTRLEAGQMQGWRDTISGARLNHLERQPPARSY
jgi:hypothetical protein